MDIRNRRFQKQVTIVLAFVTLVFVYLDYQKQAPVREYFRHEKTLQSLEDLQGGESLRIQTLIAAKPAPKPSKAVAEWLKKWQDLRYPFDFGLSEKALVFLQRENETVHVHRLLSQGGAPELVAKHPIAESADTPKPSPSGRYLSYFSYPSEDAPSPSLYLKDLEKNSRVLIDQKPYVAGGCLWLDEESFVYIKEAQIGKAVEKYSLKTREHTILAKSTDPSSRLSLRPMSPSGFLATERGAVQSFQGWLFRNAQSTTDAIKVALPEIRGQALGFLSKDRVLFIVRDTPRKSSLRVYDLSGLVRQTWDAPPYEKLADFGEIESGVMVGDFVYLVEKQGWASRLLRCDLKGESKVLYPGQADPLMGQVGRLQARGNSVFALCSGPLSPPEILSFQQDTEEKAVVVRATGVPGDLPTISGKDWSREFGQEIERPAIRLGSKDSGKSPILLETYGGFGGRISAAFDGVRALWLCLGGEVVLCSVFGDNLPYPKWQYSQLDVGRSRAAEELIGFADSLPSRPVLRGQSNGALVALVAASKEPEQFRGLFLQSAPVDLVRFDRLPMGPSWKGEMGDPWKSEHRDELRESTAEILFGRFPLPPLVLRFALNDSVVHPSHSLKLIFGLNESRSEQLWWADVPDVDIHGYRPTSVSGEMSALARLIQMSGSFIDE